MPTGRLLLVNPDGTVIEAAKIRNVFNVGTRLSARL
jgi:hypothetical protein